MPEILPEILTEPLAARFARIALGHLGREYPNKLDHVLSGPDDARTPRTLHPAFPGSFDWHSCVHGTWMLAHLLRHFPGMAPAAEARATLDAQLTPTNLDAELAYLRRPASRGFERPYGWAWLLMLAAELARHDAPWGAAIAPLAAAFAERLRDHLPLATYPVRAGTHASTAFLLRLAAEHDGGVLLPVLRDKAVAWYGKDRDCQAWEPGGEDFLSPALMEAECMRRLLPPAEFAPWLARFLPRLAEGEPETLFRPAHVSDRSDGRIAHLDGLNLSRAWCWRGLAAALPDHPAAPRMQSAAEAHLAASLPHVAGDYMGEHWLASFAVLALEA